MVWMPTLADSLARARIASLPAPLSVLESALDGLAKASVAVAN